MTPRPHYKAISQAKEQELRALRLDLHGTCSTLAGAHLALDGERELARTLQHKLKDQTRKGTILSLLLIGESILLLLTILYAVR